MSNYFKKECAYCQDRTHDFEISRPTLYLLGHPAHAMHMVYFLRLALKIISANRLENIILG
jgi:hypothetical protein